MAVQNKIQTGFQEGESNIKSFQLETCPRSFHTFQLLYRIPKLLLFRCSTKFWRIFGNKSWTFCFSLSEQSNLRIKRVSASCRQKHPSRISTLEKTNLKQCFYFCFQCSVKILCQEDKDDIMWEVSRCCSGQLEMVINQKSDKWQYPTLRELRRIIVWWRYLWWATTFFFLCF